MVISSTQYLLKDLFGRPVDRLRISVTDRCNYRCIFCHFEGTTRGSGEVFDAEDYGFIARVLSRYGVKYYKLTGGEPLLRDDIHEIVANIKRYAEEVSIVTNGSLLKEKVKLLAEAGLDRLNVSLHAFTDDVYRYVTGGSNLLYRVLEGIDEAINYGLKIKINFVLMKSNLEEFPKILEYAISRNLDLNVIELVPLGTPQDVYRKEFVSVTEVLKFIEEKSVSRYVREFQNRPVYILANGSRVEVVIGYGNRYLCSACTRMRLTSDGCFKTCLYVEKPVICIVEVVKNRDEETLAKLFKEAVYARKPFFT
jgi:cyclic pyranopterin phosphate synthase